MQCILVTSRWFAVAVLSVSTAFKNQTRGAVVFCHCVVGLQALSVSLASIPHLHLSEGNIMVVIRLSRGGSKKRPFYNIVVADSRIRRDGRFIERVGFYNPVAAGAEEALRVSHDRVSYWAGKGAQLSDTVARLVAQAKAAPAAPAAAAA